MSLRKQAWENFNKDWGHLIRRPSPWDLSDTQAFVRAVFKVQGLGHAPDPSALREAEAPKRLEEYSCRIPKLIDVVRNLGDGNGPDKIKPIGIAATLKRKIAFLCYEPNAEWEKFCLLPIFFDEKDGKSFRDLFGGEVDSRKDSQTYRELCKRYLKDQKPRPGQDYWGYIDCLLKKTGC